MKWCRFLLFVVVLAILERSAMAGLIFGRHKPDPAQHVPELIVALKTDPSERKREAAAEELRQYDAQAYPQIVPALAECATSDAKAGVRLEALESLEKIRPISQQAGWALEQAQKDSSLRVRLQARSLLVQYHVWGYRNSGGEGQPVEGPVMKEGEPVVVPSEQTPVVVRPMQPKLRPVPSPRVMASPVRSPQVISTSAEPPLLDAAPPAPMSDGPDLSQPR